MATPAVGIGERRKRVKKGRKMGRKEAGKERKVKGRNERIVKRIV